MNTKNLSFYKKALDKMDSIMEGEEEHRSKMLPSAIIRLQLLIIELVLNNYIDLKGEWHFNILLKENEQLKGFAKLAIEDFFIWFSQLYKLKYKAEFEKPKYEVVESYSNDFIKSNKVINIDFSLFERWTDEHKYHHNLIYVRTDYFGFEKNYFKVSCTEPINYKITEEDNPVLEFFLQNIFEKPSFRKGQLAIISNALNRNDTVGLLPTGGGKSLCYQLPCLLQPSINFIVCPIKSLMYDQHANMQKSNITNSNFITGDLTAGQKDFILSQFGKGKYLFIWISPERFQIQKFRNSLAGINSNLSIGYAVIDEVHCMSEWGHDFRTSYLNLTQAIQRYCPSTSFIGLTATASVNVLKDIRIEFSRNNKKLGDENIKSLLDYSREELEFKIIRSANHKFNFLKEIIEKEEILEQRNKACLVFTPNVNGSKGCYNVANIIAKDNKDKAKWYSGAVPEIAVYDDKGNKTKNKIPIMSNEDFKQYKIKVQSDFKENKFPLLVATKAFGMGIDKSNIHFTIHFGIPSSVESLYQEAGRAGRWSDKSIKAKCFVLFSPEIVDKDLVNELFDVNTTFAGIKEIADAVKWQGRDIFTQIFLFQSQKDINENFKISKLILDNYFKANSKQKIFYKTIINELRGLGFKDNNDSLQSLAQKGIYRLRLLGLVKDWTTDFVSSFEVEFNSLNDDNIKKSLLDYISKYDPNINLIKELSFVNKETVFEKCLWFLLKWTFENIAYSRKQSLKTLADWCSDFEEIGNAAFKDRIDNYFRFTNATFIFQHIAENPNEYEKWFDVFYIERDLTKGEEGIYIPQIEDLTIRKQEFERLREGLSRFLESSRNNVGLNFISGLVRLSLNDYENQDGKSRFESALNYIKSEFPTVKQGEILKLLIEFGNYFSESNKESLCFSITKYYPKQLEYLAEYYKLFYLIDNQVSMKVERLKELNRKINEELRKIE